MEGPPEHDDDLHGGSGHPLRYATGYHAPVLCETVVAYLVTDPAGCYVDGTLGGGGHSAALLDALGPEGTVIGVDQDAEALAEAEARLADAIAEGRFRTLRGNFGELERLLHAEGITAIDGLLLDLGVSSHQLDAGERGFSFQTEAPLDMRMDHRQDITADEIVNRWSEAELRRVLRAYGEEPKARRIARAIVEARPVPTTTALAAVVRRVVPTRDEIKILARVFQGIRIAVNGELERLEQVLESAVRLLRPGGRIVVMSYHSLEDRRVKRFLRYGNLRGEPVRDFYGNLITPWEDLTRKPLEASAQEVAANPRARSVRMRVAERRDNDLDNEDE